MFLKAAARSAGERLNAEVSVDLARLTRLLTLGNRRAPKGECHLDLADFLAHAEGIQAIVAPVADPQEVLDQPRQVEQRRGQSRCQRRYRRQPRQSRCQPRQPRGRRLFPGILL